MASSRRAPGTGQIVTSRRGATVYRVTLPPVDGKRRTAERTIPPHVLRGRKSDLNTWLAETRRDLIAAATVALERATSHQDGPEPPIETTGAYLTRWLAEQPTHLAPNTIAARRAAIVRHLIPRLGDVPLAALTPRQIEAALRAMPLAPSSVRTIRTVLVVALNDAVRLEVLTRNPAALARAPRAAHVDRPRFDAAQVRRLVAAAASERLGALLLLAGALGLRRGELLGLRWRDVDLDAATLRVAVQRQYEPGRGSVERPPKAGSGRLIPLPALVVESLRVHRDRQRWERQQLGWVEHGLVFARRDGHPASRMMARRVLGRVLARANQADPPLPALRLHDLRGSAATILLSLGVPLPSVMAILGHRRATTTLENYAAALPADLTEAATRMDRALQG